MKLGQSKIPVNIKQDRAVNLFFVLMKQNKINEKIRSKIIDRTVLHPHGSHDKQNKS